METQTKRKIEVFTAGCSVCSPVVDMVKSMACSDCEVIVYNLAEPCESKECIGKAVRQLESRVNSCFGYTPFYAFRFFINEVVWCLW